MISEYRFITVSCEQKLDLWEEFTAYRSSSYYENQLSLIAEDVPRSMEAFD